MDKNNHAVNDYSAVDDKISQLILLQLKRFKENPYQNTQRQRENAFDKKAYNRIIHNPRHKRISLAEISCINKHLSAKPVRDIKKIQKKQLCSEAVLPGDIKFSEIKYIF